jgi:hypothetical protein
MQGDEKIPYFRDFSAFFGAEEDSHGASRFPALCSELRRCIVATQSGEARKGRTMDILSGIFHHGLIVEDIDLAMAQMTAATSVEWTAVRAFNPLPVWTPEGGKGEARLRVAYARTGSVRLELVEAERGTPYDVLRAVDPSHIGVWVDDVGDGVETLCAQGWRVLVAGASPRHRHGAMTYLVRDGGPVIELVSRSLMPMMQDWWDS